MTTHVQKKILPSDGDQFLVIEYEDYFFTPKNNRIRVKEFGEKGPQASKVWMISKISK